MIKIEPLDKIIRYRLDQCVMSKRREIGCIGLEPFGFVVALSFSLAYFVLCFLSACYSHTSPS